MCISEAGIILQRTIGGCYLLHPPMVLWSLSNEILWPHSVESSSCFRLIEQVSY
jgi:hypothetical protein